jgi:hypothetical protein
MCLAVPPFSPLTLRCFSADPPLLLPLISRCFRIVQIAEINVFPTG